MPEATIIIIDTSDYMHNGDYSPSRQESQLECVHAIINGRLSRNPENVVGLLSSGSKSQKIVSALSNKHGEILKGIRSIQIGGVSELKKTMYIAKLALDFRPEKYYDQRVIVFVGSPIVDMNENDVREIIEEYQKNGIKIDIISFGEVVENAQMLEMFPNAMGNDCVYVPIPAGPHIMRDCIATTEIIKRDGGLNLYGDMNDAELQIAMQNSMRDFMGVDGGYDEEAALRAAIEASLNDNQPYYNNNNTNNANTNEQAMEEELDQETKDTIALSLRDAQKDNDKDNEKKDN